MAKTQVSVPVKFADGSEYDFLSLPYKSQCTLAQLAVSRSESVKGAYASGRGKKELAAERGVAAKTITPEDLKEQYYGENAPRAAMWELWVDQLHGEFKTACMEGTLDAVAPTASRGEKDRVEAAVRAIKEALEDINTRLTAKGQKNISLLASHVRNERGATEEQKEEVARKNVEIDERNAKQIADFIATATSGNTRYTPYYERHLATVKAEREAARAKAKAAQAESTVVVVDSLPMLDEAAE